MGALRLLGHGVPAARQRAQILRHQLIFRIEVPVERHLVGLGGGRDFVDAHRPDTARIEELARGVEDSLAGGHFPVAGGLIRCAQILSSSPLTRDLPVSTYRLLLTSNTLSGASHVT